jgi:hypothetical protein
VDQTLTVKRAENTDHALEAVQMENSAEGANKLALHNLSTSRACSMKITNEKEVGEDTMMGGIRSLN